MGFDDEPERVRVSPTGSGGVGVERESESPVCVGDVRCRRVAWDAESGVEVRSRRVGLAQHGVTSGARLLRVCRGRTPVSGGSGEPVPAAMDQVAAALIASLRASPVTSMRRGLARSATGTVTVRTPFS
jgi:hypothetical protein